MVKEFIHDPIFLAQRSVPADGSEADIQTADDLLDTLAANKERCVGIAANMIGTARKIIVFDNDGKAFEMFNPEITAKSGMYEAEEGCMSVSVVHKAVRYRKITVVYQTRAMQKRTRTFSGWTAQIIQHEIDHTNGILI